MLKTLDSSQMRLPRDPSEVMGGIWATGQGEAATLSQTVDQLLSCDHEDGQSSASPGTPSTTPQKNKDKESDKDPQSTQKQAKSDKKKTDVPSLRNTAFAVQNRDLGALQKRFEDSLADGATAISGSDAVQDADFLSEARARMNVGYVWLGKRLSQDTDQTKVSVLDLGAEENGMAVMTKLMDDHFQLVSDKAKLQSLVMLQQKVAELKTMTSKAELEEAVASLAASKEQAAELLSSIGVAIKDLKKNHKRRKADQLKEETAQKKRQNQQNEEKNDAGKAEVQRSLQLANLSIPFNIEKEKMTPIREVESITAEQIKPFDEPLVITKANLKDFHSDTVNVTLQKWQESFPKHDLCQKQRCVSAPMTKAMGSETCLQCLASVCKDAKVPFIPDSDLPSHLKQLAETPSLMGFREDCMYFFCEPEMTSTMRYQTLGDMDVMVARVPRLFFGSMLVGRSFDLSLPAMVSMM